jgi:hypothetical protein
MYINGVIGRRQEEGIIITCRVIGNKPRAVGIGGMDIGIINLPARFYPSFINSFLKIMKILSIFSL